eukprot:CAMPEP_0170746190 /NCGR_PEP_ID=MMETSP0437-20130122/8681_1 /TAXON_ID=0 /ORGANISM="Sexangularia sp." /LENGTH=461 /DNA_ID=CAMNT_0011084933 /DNA_START=99 /DNA_END=1484 /DNA_ORIENTATION=+
MKCTSTLRVPAVLAGLAVLLAYPTPTSTTTNDTMTNGTDSGMALPVYPPVSSYLPCAVYRSCAACTHSNATITTSSTWGPPCTWCSLGNSAGICIESPDYDTTQPPTNPTAVCTSLLVDRLSADPTLDDLIAIDDEEQCNATHRAVCESPAALASCTQCVLEGCAYCTVPGGGGNCFTDDELAESLCTDGLAGTLSVETASCGSSSIGVAASLEDDDALLYALCGLIGDCGTCTSTDGCAWCDVGGVTGQQGAGICTLSSTASAAHCTAGSGDLLHLASQCADGVASACFTSHDTCSDCQPGVLLANGTSLVPLNCGWCDASESCRVDTPGMRALCGLPAWIGANDTCGGAEVTSADDDEDSADDAGEGEGEGDDEDPDEDSDDDIFTKAKDKLDELGRKEFGGFLGWQIAAAAGGLCCLLSCIGCTVYCRKRRQSVYEYDDDDFKEFDYAMSSSTKKDMW